MRRSHTISLSIDYPFDDAYRFLANPLNFSAWAAVNPDTYRPVDDGDWEAVTSFGGLRRFRFSAPNNFGVLDHAMFVPGEPLLWTPMRVMPNGDGTELLFTFYMRPGMSEEEFASALEWITTDFLALKSLLEALKR